MRARVRGRAQRRLTELRAADHHGGRSYGEERRRPSDGCHRAPYEADRNSPIGTIDLVADVFKS